MLRPSILGAALAWAAVQPAYAQEQTLTIDDPSALKSEHGQPKSDITLSGNAAFLTQYVKRGFALSAERPAAQVEFDLFYKEIYYAGIFASNVNFGSGPNGQDLASVELDYYVGLPRPWANGASTLPSLTTPIQAPSIPVATSAMSRFGPSSPLSFGVKYQTLSKVHTALSSRTSFWTVPPKYSGDQ